MCLRIAALIQTHVPPHSSADARGGGCAEPDVDDDSQSRTESDRGRGTLVFVPWAQVNTHIINLGKREMDVFIPG